MTNARGQQRKSLGVIECLSTGFETVARRPYLLLLPFLVDLLLWQGPQLTAAPVVDQIGGRLNEAVAQAPFSAEQAKQTTEQIDELVASYRDWDLMEVAAWQVPTLALVTGVKAMGPVRDIATGGAVVGAIFLLALASTVLATLYLAPIGVFVRAGKLREAFSPLRLAVAWLRYVAYLGFLLGVVAAFGITASIVLAIASLAGAAGISIAGVLVVGLGILLYLYLYLAQEAVFVSGVWPLEAARRSMQIVSAAFWGVLGLAVLVIVITLGLGIIWSRIAGNTAGFLGAAIASDFVATGLTASVMVYYWERFRPLSDAPPLPNTTDANGRRSA